jgi:hypothetical protein
MDPSQCVAPGTLIEKRWWELGSRLWLVLLTAAATADALVGVFVAFEGSFLAAIPFGLAGIIAAVALIQRTKRRLLATGTPAIGKVTSVSEAKGIFGVGYEYPTPSGQMRGSTGFDSMRVERSFGFWPEEDDTVFVVFDSARPSQSAVWGFARR